MEWFKEYSNTPQRPAIQALSANAFRLWFEGRCYIANADTDGFIPSTQLVCFRQCGARRYVVELVGASLWVTAPTGYIDVTWGAENQRTAEQISVDRSTAAERQRKKRERDAAQKANDSGVCHGVTHLSCHALRHTVCHATEQNREEQRREEVEVAFGLGVAG